MQRRGIIHVAGTNMPLTKMAQLQVLPAGSKSLAFNGCGLQGSTAFMRNLTRCRYSTSVLAELDVPPAILFPLNSNLQENR